MADYPNLPCSTESGVTHDAGRSIDRMSDGSVRGRSLWSQPKRSWSIVHLVDNDTDANTIYDHYSTHQTASFNFTDPETGNTYSVIYGSDAIKVSYEGGDVRRITVSLEQE